MIPEVSVIMPVHNSEAYLETAARSVLSQDYPSLELILIDDASGDGSRKMIRKLAAQDQRVRTIFLQESLGPAGARNSGIEVAKGQFIAFLDSDDVWDTEKLGQQLSFMKETGAALTFTAYRKIDWSGVRGRVISVPDRVNYHSLLKSNVIGMLTAMYDRARLGTRLLPPIRKRQDYALWLRILKEGHIARGLNRPLAFYRIHRGSISRNKIDAARYQWRVYRELEGLGRMKSAWYFAHYAAYGLLKQR